MITLKIVLAEARRNWIRIAISTVAVGAAIGTVTWSLGTVATSQAQHRLMVSEMVGDYDAWVIPDRPNPMVMARTMGMQSAPEEKEPEWGLSAALTEKLTADKRIASADLFSITPVSLDLSPAGALAPQGPRPGAALTGTDLAANPFKGIPLEGKWLDTAGVIDDDQPLEVVLSSAVFWRQRLPVGSEIMLVAPQKIVPARIVGYILQPRRVFGLPTGFISTAAYEKHFRNPARPPFDAALLRFAEDTKISTLQLDLAADFAAEAAPVRLESPEDLIATLDDGATAQFRRTAPLILGLAGLAAIMIIVTTLSLGVRQRVRMLALLRSIGASRRHVYLLTLFDGILLAVLGLAAGILGGWLVLRAMVARMPDAFPTGAVLGAGAVRAAVICGLLAVIAAALIPSVQAVRLKPLDILQGVYSERRKLSLASTVTGLLLLLPAPLISTLPQLSKDLRSTLLLAVALPAIVVGSALLTPLMILLTETIFAAPLCRLVGLEPRLLRAPLSRQMGRVAGAVITVSLALGLYTAIETWGRSLTKPFLPSPGFPDVVISMLPNGVAPDKLPVLESAKGFKRGQVFPIEAAQFMLADETQAAIEANDAYAVLQNNVLVMGVDPAKAFAPSSPMLDLPFRQGNPAEAARRLAAGGACVVPQTFVTQSRLGLGEKVGIRVAAEDGSVSTVWLEIVGVIDANWHLVTARAGVRGRDGNPFRTMAVWFVSNEEASALKPRDGNIRFLWANLDDRLRKLQPQDAALELQAHLHQALGTTPVGRPMGGRGRGGPGGGSPDMGPRRGPPPIPADRTNLVAAAVAAMRGSGDANRLMVSHRDSVASGTSQHAEDIIGNMSRIPFWALGFLSLSIVSAIVASVQSRRREFGRMRALGLARSQLLRMVCIEGVLIGIAACLVSLLFGVETGWCFTSYTRAKMMFGGMPIAFQMPWRALALANGAALLLSLVAAIIPAIITSRRETVELLREGTE